MDNQKPDTSFGNWPWCRVCNKPVETVEWVDHPFHRMRHFTLHCHGAVETGNFPLEIMVNAESVTFGWAFDNGQKDNDKPEEGPVNRLW